MGLKKFKIKSGIAGSFGSTMFSLYSNFVPAYFTAAVSSHLEFIDGIIFLVGLGGKKAN